MRRLIGTSTKMNLTSSEARGYLAAIRELTATLDGVDLFVLPPFTSTWVARDVLGGSRIAWGAQDVHPDDAGAHTGDVSAPMLADLGCCYIECGHSERRRDHGESDALVARKVAAIVRHRMTPVICVGEPAQGPVAAAVRHVAAQVEAAVALLGPEAVRGVVIGYEPVWAIGVGAASAPPEHVAAVHRAIRGRLDALADGAPGARVIYGGSVNPDNAATMLAVDDVDGLFVGRSALDPAAFAEIARIALGS
jgi:triosephosphate isomerase